MAEEREFKAHELPIREPSEGERRPERPGEGQRDRPQPPPISRPVFTSIAIIPPVVAGGDATVELHLSREDAQTIGEFVPEGGELTIRMVTGGPEPR